MTQIEILFFMQVEDPCCSVPKKQTMHKPKLYSSGYTQNTKQWLDSNNWTILVQCSLMSNFDCLGGQIGSPFYIELVASCLSFPTRPISLETEFITLDLVNNGKNVWKSFRGYSAR